MQYLYKNHDSMIYENMIGNEIKKKFHGQWQCHISKPPYHHCRLLPQLKIVMGAKFYDSAQISTHKKIRDYSAL